jgi:hypothetical protein
MKFFNWIFQCFIVSIGFISLSRSYPSSFFNKCDKDKSNSLDAAEWEECLRLEEENSSPAESLFPNNLDSLFKIADKNGDGEVTLTEYGELQQKLLFEPDSDELKDDTITVKMADGKHKKMSRKDLSIEMAKRAQGFRKTKEDNIVKEENDKLKMRDIEKENPGLAKMIKLGNSSLEILKMMNHTDGKLIRINTLKDSVIALKDSEGNPIDDEDHYINLHKSNLASGKGLMVSIISSSIHSDLLFVISFLCVVLFGINC